MIRPLVDEDKLQKLEEMEISELRTEFVEQVVNLRKKVLNKIPIKKLFGVPMDGSTWIGLAQQYIQAFNEDRVPNIESSWHYICRERCQQSLAKAAEQFESQLFGIQIPMSQNELEQLLQDAESHSLAFFNESLLEVTASPDIEQQLKSSIRERADEILQQNTHACQQYAHQMLQELLIEMEPLKRMHQDPNLYQQLEFAI